MASKVGSRIPLYCSGVGKAMLADMPEDRVKEIWDSSTITALTPMTITDFDRFQEVLKEIRVRGYALDNEENELGVRCIAVSLPDYRGKTKFAFSVSAPASRMDDTRIRELSQIILRTKEKILRELC